MSKPPPNHKKHGPHHSPHPQQFSGPFQQHGQFVPHGVPQLYPGYQQMGDAYGMLTQGNGMNNGHHGSQSVPNGSSVPLTGINVAGIPSPSDIPSHFYYNADGSDRRLITDVWAENLEEEFSKIREIVDEYPFIAMDTEFPGVVARPVGNFRNPNDFFYQTLRCNVNLLKIIQLGMTFCDKHGQVPPSGTSTWQFNFKFNLTEDIYAQDSIDLLTCSGIDFEKFDEHGINVDDFAELMITAGLVLNEEVKWLSFHSGYDFGYMIKMLTGKELPAEEQDWFDLLNMYFGTLFDIKYLIKAVEALNHTCGLNQLAEDLDVMRIGPAHQAGSDSLLTCHTFFKLVSDFFNSNLDEAKFKNILYGLGSDSYALPPPIRPAPRDKEPISAAVLTSSKTPVDVTPSSSSSLVSDASSTPTTSTNTPTTRASPTSPPFGPIQINPSGGGPVGVNFLSNVVYRGKAAPQGPQYQK